MDNAPEMFCHQYATAEHNPATHTQKDQLTTFHPFLYLLNRVNLG